MTTIPAVDLSKRPWPDPNKGGQHVGASHGVQVEHLPTGITVIVNTERSQHSNMMVALDAIMGAITSPHFRG